MTARGAGGGYALVRLRSGLVLDRASPCELDNGRLVFGSAFFSLARCVLYNVRLRGSRTAHNRTFSIHRVLYTHGDVYVP